MAGEISKEIVINSKYLHLEEFIRRIPEEWGHIGKTIYKKRNEIKVVHHNGLPTSIRTSSKI